MSQITIKAHFYPEKYYIYSYKYISSSVSGQIYKEIFFKLFQS